MFDIIGRWNTARVYASSVDSESYAQVLRMCNLERLKDSRIRMMPDMHASAGCTVGTSLTVGEYVNPAYVGGDIGCGMQVYRLEEREIDFARLDECVRAYIPSGAAIFSHANPAIRTLPLKSLHCYEHLRYDTVSRSLGTLGGGNHFIEVARGIEDECLYLIIHSGSRRLGRDVALYHQNQAFFEHHGITSEEARAKGLRPRDVQSNIHPSTCFLSGENLTRYLHDMNIAVDYATLSRQLMGQTIIDRLALHPTHAFATIHNYIDTKAGVLRKGAVSAQAGEQILIPINMRDGSLLCVGKGNEDWNCTAPHGAGRVMKRSDAKAAISLDEYREVMAGVYTTSVGESTIDESPMAYRRIGDILDVIDPTAEVTDILEPVYNFKASKAVTDEEVMDGED
ncbi:MAG: RtcB family protein [Clostridia bacterium]|nr:RtcB family protein [Clostridia bacterium]